MTQYTSGAGIWTESVSNLSLSGLAMTWMVSSPLYGFYSRATVADVNSVSLAGVSITGPVKVGVQFHGSPYAINTSSVTGSVIPNIGCSGTVVSTSLTGNSFAPSTCTVNP